MENQLAIALAVTAMFEFVLLLATDYGVRYLTSIAFQETNIAQATWEV